MNRIKAHATRMVRMVIRWWWAHTGRDCVLCGFAHPHPEAWHTYPYWRNHGAWA
jgi:hypothetical protein